MFSEEEAFLLCLVLGFMFLFFVVIIMQSWRLSVEHIRSEHWWNK